MTVTYKSVELLFFLILDDIPPVFQHSITINLLGDTKSYDYPLPNNGPVMGAKSIGVFGKLILNSLETTVPWTKLNNTANSGTNTLTLSEAVDWGIGASIVVTTTSFIAHESEKLTIGNSNFWFKILSQDGNCLKVKETYSGM